MLNKPTCFFLNKYINFKAIPFILQLIINRLHKRIKISYRPISLAVSNFVITWTFKDQGKGWCILRVFRDIRTLHGHISTCIHLTEM